MRLKFLETKDVTRVISPSKNGLCGFLSSVLPFPENTSLWSWDMTAAWVCPCKQLQYSGMVFLDSNMPKNHQRRPVKLRKTIEQVPGVHHTDRCQVIPDSTVWLTCGTSKVTKTQSRTDPEHWVVLRQRGKRLELKPLYYENSAEPKA